MSDLEQIERLQRETREQKAEIARLQDLLFDYGQHGLVCPNPGDPRRTCDCGWAAVLGEMIGGTGKATDGGEGGGREAQALSDPVPTGKVLSAPTTSSSAPAAPEKSCGTCGSNHHRDGCGSDCEICSIHEVMGGCLSRPGECLPIPCPTCRVVVPKSLLAAADGLMTAMLLAAHGSSVVRAAADKYVAARGETA